MTLSIEFFENILKSTFFLNKMTHPHRNFVNYIRYCNIFWAINDQHKVEETIT